MEQRDHLAWLLAATVAACTPSTAPPSEPDALVADPVVAEPDVPHAPIIPPVSEILFEVRHYSTMPNQTRVAFASFPEVTVYTDGTVLRANRVSDPKFRLEPGHARLSPEQLTELRERLDALAPFDVVEKVESYCELDPSMLHTSARYHARSDYRIRVGDDRWVCLPGCPIAPVEFADEFIELLRFVETFAELEYEPWQPIRGHVAAHGSTPDPVALPWANERIDPYFGRAWVLGEAHFADAWALVNRSVLDQLVVVEGRSYIMSVVPWRPGEDASRHVAQYNDNARGRKRDTACDEHEEWPRPRPK